MKKCTKCNEDKDDTCYSFRNKQTGRLQSVCKDCQKGYKKTHYYNNKAQHYARNEKSKSLLREYLNEIKKPGCIICKETYTTCLEFHHLDPKGKDKNVSELYLYGSKKRIEKEVEKCVLLCANCHRKVHGGVIVL